MQLQLQTWMEVEAYLQSSRGIILPIGSTEQHGPTGLIGTDALCAEVIAKGVGEAANALVAPTIAVGMAQHHLGFAGSMTLRPSTLVAVLRDLVGSLARHGFDRFYFINGHGGNIASVTAAFSEIYAERSLLAAAHTPPIKCRLRNWWQNEAVRQLSKELYGNAEGAHANPSEVAVTQFACPDAINSAPLDPPVARGASLPTPPTIAATSPTAASGPILVSPRPKPADAFTRPRSARLPRIIWTGSPQADG